jgi:hypothetical protein
MQDAHTDAMDRHEVLDVDPGRSWRPSPRVMVVIAIALVVGGLLVLVDQRSRASELRALDACRQELHETAVATDLQMMAVATTVHPPPASTGTARTHAGLAGVMSRSARQLLPQVGDADQACGAVSVRPWHFSLRARRDATTAYARALAAKLQEVAADGRISYVEDRTLRRLRQDADLEEFGGRS